MSKKVSNPPPPPAVMTGDLSVRDQVIKRLESIAGAEVLAAGNQDLIALCRAVKYLLICHSLACHDATVKESVNRATLGFLNRSLP